MAEFTAAVYQNEFLPDGGTDVNAIVTVTCTGAGAAGRRGAATAGEIIIVDTSGSMGRSRSRRPSRPPRRRSTRSSTAPGSRSWPARTLAYLAYPPRPSGAGMVRMDPSTRVPRRTRRSRSSAPTAAPRWAPG